MLTPAEEASLRDAMCIQLLEATSDPAALTRARREERENVPAYDDRVVDFGVRSGLIQPRDLILACACCGEWFVARLDHGRFCSDRCRVRAATLRRRAEVA